MNTPSSFPLVAIGLPTRNRAKYLPYAIDSLLNQTYKNIRLIVSDNASTDETQKLCESYAKKDPRFVYIRQSIDIGQSPNATFALNQVIAAADYCMLASDDDIWDTRFIEACMKKLNADPQAIVAFPRHATMYWKNNTVIEHDPKTFFPFDKDKYLRLKKFILTYSINNRGIPMYGLWHKWPLLGEQFIERYEDDISFVFRCLSRGYFVHVDEGPLFFKGKVPGTEPLWDKPATAKRVIASIANRIRRSRTEFGNMAFIMGLTDLSLWQRSKLIMWNLLVVGRLFVMRKT